jgi:uncharacterized protein YjbI with pentapeptide repeats
LKEADLSEANMGEANLGMLAYTSEPNFTGAKYTKNTIWPAGYDPEKAGAILVTSGE